mgnify:CR=1 FL=1
MLTMKSEARGLIAHGVSCCAGCGLELAARIILDVLGPNTVIVIPPGCAALFHGCGHETVTQSAGFPGKPENSGASASGTKAGCERPRRAAVTRRGRAAGGGSAAGTRRSKNARRGARRANQGDLVAVRSVGAEKE